MTKERSIEICEKIINNNSKITREARKIGDTNTMQLVANLDKESLAIETVLSILKERDKEIEKLKKFINSLQLKNVKDLSTKIYMANFINDNTPYTKDTKELENEEGTRTVDFTVKYFESKAEKE